MIGPDAEFRVGQREAIDAVLHGGRRALVVQRTGWGKSIVYWIATRIRRDAGHGPTLIVSPLLSLMRNQITMAEKIGIRAATINSSNNGEWEEIEACLFSDACDVLMISPERFGNDDFTQRVLPKLRSIGLFVVDEAHCISDWGHDFRPDYRRIGRILGALPASVPVLATTATANNRVIEDVAEQLGDAVEIYRGPMSRDTLRLQNIALADQSQRLAWLAEQIPRLPGSGIVYCLTVADTQRVARWLQDNGITAEAYNADIDNEDRLRLEAMLVANEVKCLVATVALGMGFDKPDLGFVVHYQRPGSVVAYYQQVGRAGRAVDEAHAILLSGREDDEIGEYFIATAFPPTAHMQEVVDELAGVESLSIRQLESRLNLRHSQIEKALKLLEVDGAVAKEGGRYFRTANAWTPDVQRIERVTQHRRAELAQMQTYVQYPGCLMEFLARALDDPSAAPCGRCANETGLRHPARVHPALVDRATTFLKRDARPIQPRSKWPPGAVDGFKGGIVPANEPGFALCVYGDAGWGQLVASGKYETGIFDRRLVEAAAELVRRRWSPDPYPEWVTAIPSTRRPGLLGNFGREVARYLGLPFAEPLAAMEGRDQKAMENSAQQLRNVMRKIKVVSSVPPGPVLLIDDIVDSRWTLTYAGWLLQRHGAGAVYPFALATAAARDDS